jgi:hypothetical protein
MALAVAEVGMGPRVAQEVGRHREDAVRERQDRGVADRIVSAATHASLFDMPTSSQTRPL